MLDGRLIDPAAERATASVSPGSSMTMRSLRRRDAGGERERS
jgi:hypothetical protein